jgi:GTPase SAR1 family protein
MVKRNFYQIHLIGEPGVGKTSFIRRYFGKNTKTTAVGSNWSRYRVKYNYQNLEIELVMIDFHNMSPHHSYKNKQIANELRGSQGVLYFYDISRINTLKWGEEIIQLYNNQIENMMILRTQQQDMSMIKPPLFLIGNKKDLGDQPEIDPNEEIDFHKRLSFDDHLKISVHTGENCDQLLDLLIPHLLQMSV